MKDVIPNNADWIKQSVDGFDPENNVVCLENGEKVKIVGFFIDFISCF